MNNIKENIIIRFAGDSGDGIQLLGNLFATSSNDNFKDLHSFPDFPAEIRAPVGSEFGVSAFQIQIGNNEIKNMGDQVDILVCFNPVSLIKNYHLLKEKGILIYNENEFTEKNVKKYDEAKINNILSAEYNIIPIALNDIIMNSLKHLSISRKQILLCKNIFILGYLFKSYGYDDKQFINWLLAKFDKESDLYIANEKTFKEGKNYATTTEEILYADKYVKEKDDLVLSGSEAISIGILLLSYLSGRKTYFSSYPITPASNILHFLSKNKNKYLEIFQAEDEIAAICSAIGASFAGALGVTSTSGPGLALMSEALGMAVSYELPLLIVNSQRAGPSTGMPTKVEQSDLNISLHGRSGDAPIPILAASYPDDAIDVLIKAAKIAVEFMTPVIYLSDGYLNNVITSVEKTDIEKYDKFKINKMINASEHRNNEGIKLWHEFGNKNHIHRIGSLEKDYHTNNISYDADNHQLMTNQRFKKIDLIQQSIGNVKFTKKADNKDFLILAWGSSFGIINDALRKSNLDVSYIHMVHIYPLPVDFKDVISEYKHVLLFEMNNGQCKDYIQSTCLVKINSVTKVKGQPFLVNEIIDNIERFIKENDT